MGLNRIKTSLAVAWVLAIVVLGVVLRISSGGALVVLAGFALLPPIVMWRLWTEPTQTMSESIQAGRR